MRYDLNRTSLMLWYYCKKIHTASPYKNSRTRSIFKTGRLKDIKEMRKFLFQTYKEISRRKARNI